ncbi:MAG: hypothetical protein ABW106_09365 [Steroidobacteraceae bacterium]
MSRQQWRTPRANGGALMSLGMTVNAFGESLVHLDLIDIEGSSHRVLSVTAVAYP